MGYRGRLYQMAEKRYQRRDGSEEMAEKR